MVWSLTLHPDYNSLEQLKMPKAAAARTCCCFTTKRASFLVGLIGASGTLCASVFAPIIYGLDQISLKTAAIALTTLGTMAVAGVVGMRCTHKPEVELRVHQLCIKEATRLVAAGVSLNMALYKAAGIAYDTFLKNSSYADDERRLTYKNCADLAKVIGEHYRTLLGNR